LASEEEHEPQTEDNTLTRFLSEPDLGTTDWPMDSSVDIDFNDIANLELDLDQAASQATNSGSGNNEAITTRFEFNEAFLASTNGEGRDFLDLPGRLLGSSWQSPLHISVKKGHTKIIRLLLKHKADCNERDSEGLTPLMLATIRGYDDVADLLLLNGAKIQHVNNQDQSALHLAVLHGHNRLLATLLQHCKGDSSIINGYAKNGKMPLHIAIDMGFEAAVELLLESGADVQHKARTLEA
jgi:hypothetical protein